MSKQRQRHPSRDIAMKLYLYTDMAQKEIADDLGLSEKTVCKWADEDKWRELKQALTRSPEYLIKKHFEHIEKIYKQAKEEDDRPVDSKEADTISKLSNAIKHLDTRVDVSITMTVLKGFNEYVKPLDMEFAKKAAAYFIPYIKSIN